MEEIMKQKHIGIRTILLLVLIAILALVPFWIKTPYILGIFVTTFYIACGTIAWSILGGLTGQTSLGHAGFMGLGAYITALLTTKAGISPWICMLIAFLVVGLIAGILMAPCFVLSGAYFSLVTIAFSEAFRNLFINWEYAGSGQGILIPIKKGFWWMRWVSKVPYYYISLFMVILFFIILRSIDHSKLGFALKTIREDEDTAKAIGINPFKYKFIATFLSAGLIAVVGVFYANYIGYINSDIMDHSYSLNYVMPAIIGGVGNIAGPLLGSAILTPLSEFLSANLSSVANGLNLIVYAAIVIVVILFQPNGIMGWFAHSRFKKNINQKLDAVNVKLFKMKPTENEE